MLRDFFVELDPACKERARHGCGLCSQAQSRSRGAERRTSTRPSPATSAKPGAGPIPTIPKSGYALLSYGSWRWAATTRRRSTSGSWKSRKLISKRTSTCPAARFPSLSVPWLPFRRDASCSPNATTKSLNFRGAASSPSTAENAQVRGAVFLHGGFQASGVSFPYAVIEGRLSCEGSTFLPSNGFGNQFRRRANSRQRRFQRGLPWRGRRVLPRRNNPRRSELRRRHLPQSLRRMALPSRSIATMPELPGMPCWHPAFVQRDAVSLSEAKIGGTLNCTQGRFVQSHHRREGRRPQLRKCGNREWGAP